MNVEVIGIDTIVSFCFNRYMVECEYGNIIDNYDDICRFNRYMVECESLTYALRKSAGVQF